MGGTVGWYSQGTAGVQWGIVGTSRGTVVLVVCVCVVVVWWWCGGGGVGGDGGCGGGPYFIGWPLHLFHE